VARPREKANISIGQFINRFSINFGNAGHVFGGFQATFDFHTANACLDNFGQEFQSSQVLGTEQIFPIAQVNLLAIGN
jgi:hypothetical protein